MIDLTISLCAWRRKRPQLHPSLPLHTGDAERALEMVERSDSQDQIVHTPSDSEGSVASSTTEASPQSTILNRSAQIYRRTLMQSCNKMHQDAIARLRNLGIYDAFL